MTTDVVLRPVTDEDLAILFQHQIDPVANHMAAFTWKDPADRAAFDARWTKFRAGPTFLPRAILVAGRVAGVVMSYEMSGDTEVTYWIGREHWGRGVATRALRAFLREQCTRPLHARVAKDNAGSIRVLTKCGFRIVGEERGFANARGQEIDEVVLLLDGDETASTRDPSLPSQHP